MFCLLDYSPKRIHDFSVFSLYINIVIRVFLGDKEKFVTFWVEINNNRSLLQILESGTTKPKDCRPARSKIEDGQGL